MSGKGSQPIDTIVSTLLHIGGRVLEVSRAYAITNAWGAELPGIQDDKLIAAYRAIISESFATGESRTWEYAGADNETFSIRVLPIHPVEDHVFLVIEQLHRHEHAATEEYNWKKALDAAGDGMWESNPQTGEIFFSEKWHELFGYDISEITSAKDWTDKIHPADLAKAQSASEDYQAGKTPSYSAELRYRCKDGSYKWILSRGIIVSRTADGTPLRFIGTHTDINSHKAAQERFSSVAQMLSKLINNLRDGILVTDEHNRVLFANQMFCDMYELDVPPIALIGMDVYESIRQRMPFYTDPERFRTRTESVLNKKEIVLNEEWTMVNGKTMSRDFIPLMLGENDKGGIWKFRDISTQKDTEKRLDDLRNFYEGILNHIAADIVAFDPEMKYLFINPSAIKNPELRKWMIGKTDVDYCLFRNKPLSMVEKRTAILNQAVSERRNIEWEEKVITGTGDAEYHLRNSYPVFDEQGNHVMTIGYGLNITDRVLTQQALKTSEETFASAFNHSGIGIALLAPDGKWVDANDQMCRMTGYTKEELLQLSIQDITYKDDLEADTNLLRKMLRKELSTYSIEKRYVSKQNKIVLVLLTVSLVWNSDGTPKFFIAQALDITEKKALEKEIRQQNRELEAARASLVNKIAQLEELSYIIAHNLRGPAGNIKMLSGSLVAKNDGLKSSVDNLLSDAFTDEEVIGLIHDSSVSLLDSLATLMKITEIKLNKDIPYDNCEVQQIIKDITNQLHATIFEKRATIKTDLQVSHITYPKAYLENILYNLISNALKYSFPDKPPMIQVTTRMSGDKVQIVVKDNGLGIDLKRYGDKVFKLNEVFHKGHDSKGVGLYITKTQIESFGGSIIVNSELNQGAEFIVTL